MIIIHHCDNQIILLVSHLHLQYEYECYKLRVQVIYY